MDDLACVVAGKARIFPQGRAWLYVDGAFVSPRGVCYPVRCATAAAFAETLATADGCEAHDGTPG